MPGPTSATTVQRPDLRELAWEYMSEASRRGFIGSTVLPFFPVAEKTADYPKIPIESLLKVPDMKRAPRADYARGGWEFETGTYNCEEYGWEEPVDDVEASLYQRFFDAEMVSTEISIDHLLRSHEKRAAASLFNTANAVGNAGVSVEWSTPATATPKDDVKTAKQAMRGLSGLEPNTIVMSLKVFENVMVTTEIKDYLQYTSPHLLLGRQAQMDTLARYFEVDRVLVGGAIEDTAAKGQAASIGDLWDDEFVSLCKLSDGSQRLREPVFGRTFLWREDSPIPVVVETYREEQRRSTIVRARHNTDEAVVFAGANYLLTNITA